VGVPISLLRLLSVDVVILFLQLTMLAITASTTLSTAPSDGTRTIAPLDLDREEQGFTDELAESRDVTALDTGYEHVVVRVGVVETIKSLWDNDVPIVRRVR